ncbi:MAG: hypothetical protein EOP10_01410 [Proteobacteria bacterium]|nr:MAG: hypothetical protein EOP10_01410 [Pseudomonadota bacterium]
MFNRQRTFCFALLALCSTQALAHTDSELVLPKDGLSVDFQSSLSYRNEAVARRNEVYRIPGALMGGEALPSKKGLGVDEVFLVPTFRIGETYGFLKIGRHLGSEDLELDHVLVGHRVLPNFAIEAGKMASAMTPFNGQHVLETNFTSRRLLYDALWGGQLNDEGIRLKAQFFGLETGVELWKGASFPARQSESDKSAADVYARYHAAIGDSHLTVGAFAYEAKADLRDDDRYAAGHSHGTTLALDPSYFTGDVSTQGAHFVYTNQLNPDWSMGVEGEISQMKQDGRLSDATHDAAFASKIVGLWAEAAVGYQGETLSFRSERLKIQNDIYGSAALVLSEKLGLADAEDDPYRYSVSYKHRFTPMILSRIEWSKDSTTDDKKDVFTAGFVFNGPLYTSGSPKE